MFESPWAKAGLVAGGVAVGAGIGYWAKGKVDEAELEKAHAKAAELAAQAATGVRGQQRSAFQQLTNQ